MQQRKNGGEYVNILQDCLQEYLLLYACLNTRSSHRFDDGLRPVHTKPPGALTWIPDHVLTTRQLGCMVFWRIDIQ